MQSSGIPESARESVGILASLLTEGIKDNMLSLALVGSVLSEDYCPKHSDINSILAVHERVPEVLEYLAKIKPALERRRLSAPLLFRPEYIEHSCDVFSVEWLDYQWRHHTLAGAYIFSGLTFDKCHVRLQCEREYKSALVRLRQGYIESRGKPGAISQLIAAAGCELLSYLRATLWLHDAERPVASATTFEQVGKLFDVTLAVMSACYAKRYESTPLTTKTALSGFWQTYNAIERLAESMDRLKVCS